MSTVKVELTPEEIDLLDNALLAWEREPDNASFLGSMMSIIRLPPGASEIDVQAMHEDKEKHHAKEKTDRRRRASFMRTNPLSTILTRSEQS